MRERYYKLGQQNKDRKPSGRPAVLVGFAALVCVGILATSVMLYAFVGQGGPDTDGASSADTLLQNSVESESVSSVVSEAVSSAVVSSEAVSSAAVSSAAASSQAVSSAAFDNLSSTARVSSVASIAKPPTSSNAQSTAVNSGAFSAVVPESEKVPLSYFDDAALLGDSRAVGLPLYTELGNHITNYAVTSCTAKMVLEGTDKVQPIIKKIEANKGKFKKVYIMLGLNEIGHTHTTIMSRYATIIDRVRAAQPNAVIYIQTVLPITRYVQARHSYLKKDRIIAFNKKLAELAQQKRVYLIDPTSVFVDSEGYMVNAARASAGNETGEIHFNPTYTNKWLDYLRTHTVK